MKDFFQKNKLITLLSLIFIGLVVATWQFAGIKKQLTGAANPNAFNLPLPKIADVSFQASAVFAADGPLQRVYFAKNEDEKRAIASLTKLFSAAVVWENYDMTSTVKIKSSAVFLAQTVDGVRIDLRDGDTIRVFDLLSAMLVDSSNEAAYALAEAWPKGGFSPEEKRGLFVQAMNEAAKRAGLANTVLSDPAGLDDSGSNYSTAADLARFAMWLNRYPVLLEMTQRPEYRFYSLNGNRYELTNTNKLLGLVKGIILAKTGYTERSGQSIVIEVNQNGRPAIVVLLNAEDRFKNAQELIKKIKDLTS